MTLDDQRAQAAIETIGVCLLVLMLAFGGWDVLRVVQARADAHRLADQAAVLTLEHRPLPAWLKRSVTVSRGRVVATVHVCAVTSGIGCLDVRAEGKLPRAP
jgi:hypothetical protein